MNTLIKSFLSVGIILVSIQIDNKNTEIYQEKTLEESIEEGQWIYEDFCARCHLPNGEGVSGVYPPLNNSDWLKNKVDLSIASVKYGLEGEIVVNGETYNNAMIAQGLSDDEVADVMNYIMNSWDNTQEEMITLSKVQDIKEP